MPPVCEDAFMRLLPSFAVGALLAGCALSLSACALFNLEAACVDDTSCPFSRVCVDGHCKAADPGQGADGGETDAGIPPCTDTLEVDAPVGIDLSGDTSALTRAGTSCVRINGDVTSGSVTSLTALSRVVAITGRFEVRDSGITSFAGCERLTTIGGDFRVIENGALTSFDGLAALQNVGSLDVSGNDGISSEELTALEAQVGTQAN